MLPSGKRGLWHRKDHQAQMTVEKTSSQKQRGGKNHYGMGENFDLDCYRAANSRLGNPWEFGDGAQGCLFKWLSGHVKGDQTPPNLEINWNSGILQSSPGNCLRSWTGWALVSTWMEVHICYTKGKPCLFTSCLKRSMGLPHLSSDLSVGWWSAWHLKLKNKTQLLITEITSCFSY